MLMIYVEIVNRCEISSKRQPYKTFFCVRAQNFSGYIPQNYTLYNFVEHNKEGRFCVKIKRVLGVGF